MYLLPAIDILGGKVVRLAKGDYAQATVYHDDPVAQAQAFKEAGATWLHVVDLDGARSGKPENTATIEKIITKTQLKVEAGGGIRSIEAIQRLSGAGVSRVVLGTSLVTDPAFTEAALAHHRDLLAAGIDARGGEVALAGWSEGAGIPAEELVARVASLGFKHLVYTDIERDGMQVGVDAAAYVRIAGIFGSPVIASGGVAGIPDIEALGAVADSIEGIIVGRAIYEKELDVAAAVMVCAEATRRAGEVCMAEDPCGGGCLCE
ncbi:MAG: 1-(5-phosphoribosyl)-5-[(5-phosphoribosylamino)methylideneamino]imidazole-4-carboxamide isomerase [Eggerthellaceae bacterium]|jgi:phosphoribosylformimino-5-aminoimidazole carboxamide ribotide isomerase|nr:1-(5-phosphoribosyl)-5-[(5-phosphoribosylamino)methylideneamino]imidazole-4-carboxamide isomerase [Eggerthellaceae bacterium]MDR2715915.1 1-(5-phosphoribosyl)-5-[(5-phosphoribosylamino)methylideneamino]imidazole-4-carboxamide isomerase [Coriobacteriaceae bacterium]